MRNHHHHGLDRGGIRGSSHSECTADGLIPGLIKMNLVTSSPMAFDVDKTCSGPIIPFNPPGETAYHGRHCYLPCLEGLEHNDRYVHAGGYFVGVIANLGTMCLIMRTILKERSSVSSPVPYIPIVLLLTLCITDVTCLLIGGSFWALAHLVGSWLGGRVSYLFSIFVLTTCTRLSRCIVVVMGLERYMSFKHPFLYDQITNIKRVVCIILICITFYSFMASTLFTSALAGLEHPNNACDNKTASLALQSTLELVYDIWTLVENIVLFFILLYCNIVVILCMRKLRIRVRLICPRNKAEYTKQKEMVHGIPAEFSRLMVAITILTLITTLPYEVSISVSH